MGLDTILAARRILIIAYGAHKADAVRAMHNGPVTPQCPASFLQEHSAVHVYLDESAAAKLKSPRSFLRGYTSDSPLPRRCAVITSRIFSTSNCVV